MKKDEYLTKKLSTRMSEEEYETFKKLCHLEFSQMAGIVRELILGWMEKRRKKLK